MQFIGSNLKTANLNLAYVDGDTILENANFEEPSIVDGACEFVAFQRVSIRLSCAHTNRCCTSNFGHCRQQAVCAERSVRMKKVTPLASPPLV